MTFEVQVLTCDRHKKDHNIRRLRFTASDYHFDIFKLFLALGIYGVRVAHFVGLLCCVQLVCSSSFCVLCPMLPVSLDCLFLAARSVFSSV